VMGRPQNGTGNKPIPGDRSACPRLPGFCGENPLPDLRGHSQTVEDLGHFPRDCRVALAEQPAGVIDQKQVAAEGEPL